MKMTDDTLALLKNPYRFIAHKCRDLGSDVYETRIFMQKAYCMTGKEAAELFYNPEFFKRDGASPEAIRATLFGKGGLQGLDGKEHAHRKLMFMSLMSQQNTDELKHLFADKLRDYLEHWSQKKVIVFYDEIQQILTEAVCAWAGIALSEEDKFRRTKEIVSLFDSAGVAGPAHFLSRVSRKNAEDWIKNLVIDLRSDGYEPLIKTPVEVIVWHRDLNDELLKPQMAAVEILNLIRPTVAVSVYLVFMLHALHFYPEVSEKLQQADEDYEDYFLNEVRRYYPFFPSVMARIKQDFTWRGVVFKKGARALLDLYGTNNDPRSWDAPHLFMPERFSHPPQNSFAFIPQGGGNAYTGHRCPGERLTLELMKTCLHFLLNEMSYEVPEQDLHIDWSRLPALPKSQMILSHVHPKNLFIQTRVRQVEVSEFY